MTYETGTAVDLEDLLAKLSTFATTTHGGWTAGYSPNPNTTNGWFELHKGSLSFSAKYEPVTPQHLSIHQATAFVNSSTAPGKHTNDSGNGYRALDTGYTDANLATGRFVEDIGDGPFSSYHFFAFDTAPRDYIYVSVQAVPGRFRHFGFGSLVKFGDNWTGGEFAYGHSMDNTTTAVATDTGHTGLLDGPLADSTFGATVRIGGGLLNIGAAVWGTVASDNTIANDPAGNPRRQIHGGFRSGMGARGFANVVGNASSGVIPMTPISAWYKDPNNPRVQLLGHMPDVRFLNIRNFENEQEVTVGADTWVVFPYSIKTQASIQYRSQYLGIAYRKRT